MDVKTSTGGWEKMRTSVGGVIGRGVWGKGVIDSLKDLTKNLENAEEKINADDSDGVISFHHVDRKTTYQEIYEKMNTLYDFSGVAHGIVEETIDDKFYQEIDKYAETMRDLSIENYSTDNIIGAQQMDPNFSTSYMQTPQMIDKKKVGVDDLFGDNSVLGKRMKSELEAYLKQNPDKKMDYEDYKGAMLHSRAFDYTSIKDGQMEKEMWWNLGILVVTVAATIVCPPAGAALFLITDALELGSALSGEDWISGRKLGGGERAFRGGLSLIGLGALGAFSKGAKALGKVENIGDGVKGLGKSAGSKVKDFGKLSEPIDLMSKALKNHSVINKSTATGDELLKYLNRIDKNLAEEFFKTGKWPDHIQVPKSSNVLTKTGAIDWAQVPNDGFVLDKAGNAIKESYVPSVGTKFDRYGAADGRFTSPLENGEKFLYDQRSLPYVEEINKYHKYEITGDFSNIEAKINNANPVLKKAVESYMEQWDLSYNQLNIQAGEIAKGFGSSGGGMQWQMPLPLEMLIDLGLIKKI